MTPMRIHFCLLPAIGFVGCSTSNGDGLGNGNPPSPAALSTAAQLGEKIFKDASVADVVTKLSTASYASDIRALFGEDIFANPAAAFDRLTLALQKYKQEETGDFAPYSSKYVALLGGRTLLSAHELRSLALYNDPQKGNCAGCHPSARGPGGAPPLFTYLTDDNLGVPRNPDIPANADANYFDLGICSPDRTDVVNEHRELCGAFKAPALRNMALTTPYFHNGRFDDLRDVLRFYVQRDIHPEEFYPLDLGGQPLKFNDLPPEYRANVTQYPH